MKKIFSFIITMGILFLISLLLRIDFIRAVASSIFYIAFAIIAVIATIASLKSGRILLGIILAIFSIATIKNIPFMFSIFW